jgi:hypothetical protein
MPFVHKRSSRLGDASGEESDESTPKGESELLEPGQVEGEIDSPTWDDPSLPENR